MPKYRVLEKCFVDNHLRQEGDVIDYSGPPYSFLEPVVKAESKAVQPAIAKPVAQEPIKKKWVPKAAKDANTGTV